MYIDPYPLNIHNLLCRYINEHRQRVAVTTGYLEGTEYITPLNIWHVVPGHIQNRISVNESITNKLGVDCNVSSMLKDVSATKSYRGCGDLAKHWGSIYKGMLVNDILTHIFDILVLIIICHRISSKWWRLMQVGAQVLVWW